MRRVSAFVLAALIAVWAGPVYADNAMGYSLLTPDEAAGLPKNHGALGLDIERSQVITDSGMTFDLIRVKQARRGSAGAQAGLKAGDQIIAIDGRVFPSLATFAAYVGSLAPGRRASVDYIPAGGGPGQAQRIVVAIGTPAQQAAAPPQAPSGLSTGTKVAIGVGAAALLGCYEMGCFSHHAPAQPPVR
jgi:S1-C subfamily serine protease